MQHGLPALRVALVTGSLGRGGAEKQLVYLAQALHEYGVDVRVYSLTRGEYFERHLQASGIDIVFIGRFSNPAVRLTQLVVRLRAFHPHVVQASQFFSSPYVELAAPTCGAVGVSSIRSDLIHNLVNLGRVGQLAFKLSRAFVVNSAAAKQNAITMGMDPASIHVLSNVINVQDFDARSRVELAGTGLSRPRAVCVGRLVPNKRVDRFLRALSLARRSVPNLSGMVVGAGPLEHDLHVQARTLGLDERAIQFLGAREDVPPLLRTVDVLLMTSEHEGFPNVLLEAMAASLPVIATPAGDAGRIVENGITGHVIDFDDVNGLATVLVRLARSPKLRRQMGAAGRQKVESEYRWEGLAEQACGIYNAIAHRQGNRRTISALSSRSLATKKLVVVSSVEYDQSMPTVASANAPNRRVASRND